MLDVLAVIVDTACVVVLVHVGEWFVSAKAFDWAARRCENISRLCRKMSVPAAELHAKDFEKLTTQYSHAAQCIRRLRA